MPEEELLGVSKEGDDSSRDRYHLTGLTEYQALLPISTCVITFNPATAYERGIVVLPILYTGN